MLSYRRLFGIRGVNSTHFADCIFHKIHTFSTTYNARFGQRLAFYGSYWKRNRHQGLSKYKENFICDGVASDLPLICPWFCLPCPSTNWISKFDLWGDFFSSSKLPFYKLIFSFMMKACPSTNWNITILQIWFFLDFLQNWICKWFFFLLFYKFNLEKIHSLWLWLDDSCLLRYIGKYEGITTNLPHSLGNGHTMLKIPVLVRSLKSSNIGPG